VSSDFLVVEEPLLADRTTIQNFDECPAKAKFIADGRVMTSSHDAEVGNAIHAAFGEVLTEYVESRGNLGVTDLVDTTVQLLCASRPDVQSDALRSARPSLWAWAKYVNGIHWQNILRYDGGDGEHSGQLAWDLEDMNVRVTSEVDFLHTGRAPELVTEIDYKTGHKLHTAADIEASFQFAMHAWLILENYPQVECVSIRVWNTRVNNLTYGVNWKRADLYQLQFRIRQSVTNWLRYRDKPAEECPTWPTVEKCLWCPAAALCPAIPADVQKLTADPDWLVETMVATQAKLDALEKIATGIVESTGRDIVTASGAAFGTQKPKANRKPTKSLYAVKGKDGDD
jgi:hypothetical protein